MDIRVFGGTILPVLVLSEKPAGASPAGFMEPFNPSI